MAAHSALMQDDDYAEDDRVPNTPQRWPARMALFVGSILAAVGIVLLFVAVAIWQERRAGWYGTTMLIAFAAVLIAWLLIRKRFAGWLPQMTRQMLMLAMPMLLFCTVAEGFVDTKWRADVAAMKSDLRNLVTVEERVYSASGRYSTNPDSMSVSKGVSRPLITLTSNGWTAEVKHQEAWYKCSIYVGTPPTGQSGNEGYPECTRTGVAPFPWKELAVGLGLLMAGLLVASLARFGERTGKIAVSLSVAALAGYLGP